MNLPKTPPVRETPETIQVPTAVGVEWIVDAAGCDELLLRDGQTLGAVFRRIITELNLQVVGETHWHQFPMPGGGLTGFALLTESHLACHTYPEHGIATFNLYCCRARPQWAWSERLREMLGAKAVTVRSIERYVMKADYDAMPSDESVFLQAEFITASETISGANGGCDER